MFSDYRPDSGINRLEETAGSGRDVPVADELWAVLREAQVWAGRTEGAFDVTIGPLTRLWRWSARRGEAPSAERLAAARAAVGSDGLVLDNTARTVRLNRSGMSLDLGGIAKGWAADRTLAVLEAHGFASAMIDAGGDLVLGEAPPDASGWRVKLPDGAVLLLANVAIATSGDTYRHRDQDGIRFSHLIDPRIGLGIREKSTVTVVASDGATADVLASALTILGEKRARKLLAEVPGASASVSGTRSWRSPHFPDPVRETDR